MFTFTFMFTFTSMSNVDAHVHRQPDRCRPEREKQIFQKLCVFSSALEACLCKGIAFGMHPWLKVRTCCCSLSFSCCMWDFGF